MSAPFEVILAPPPAAAHEEVEGWWLAHRQATAHLPRPVDRAIVGGARVDRLGFAFAAGYRAALDALGPDLPADALASLAATEAGGGHPRAIHTTLGTDADGLYLEGQKEWVTLGRRGGVLLVVAALPAAEPPGPRPVLRLVRIDADAPGVTLEALPRAPFVPEIPHARVALTHVRVAPEAVLPGDGYDDYLKPFRTVEDLHVHAAILAWLGAVTRRAGAPRALTERLLATLAAARALTAEDPRAPALHLATAGLLELTRSLLADLEPLLAREGGAFAERWTRDRALLGVAAKARAQRTTAAWSHFSP